MPIASKTTPMIDAEIENGTPVHFQQGRLSASAAPPPSMTRATVTRNEITSIKALTAYVAYNKSVPEEVVTAYLHAEFNVPTIDKLRREDYEDVVKFLVDLRKELMIN